eukprot:Sspe_Gene.799::Locus_263_Transcript_1_1_Confidence_1.000_Length_1931::g.799::m.799
MTAKQLAAACAKLTPRGGSLPPEAAHQPPPRRNDHNTRLQINVFDSSSDYRKYGRAIFGASTDNGGIYLEGTPSKQGNVPKFLAFEADYANPDHYVWNLEHELRPLP